MNVFTCLKFKMKLGFECWRRGCKLQDLVKQAILKTIDETRVLAIANLQKHLYSDHPDDGAPAYSQKGGDPELLFGRSATVDEQILSDSNGRYLSIGKDFRRCKIVEIAKHLREMEDLFQFDYMKKYLIK